MRVVHRIVLGVVAALIITACGPVPANETPLGSVSQALSTESTTQQSGDVIWGRVPYCNCFAGSATASVTSALKEANLNASVKELSPRDGWLYFAVTYDPDIAPVDKVDAAIVAGGGEVLEDPP
jgi:hypothetical protein